MWDSEHFPTGNVPWQLLIRARTASEIDAVVSSMVVARISEVASLDVARLVAGAATRAAGASQEKATPAQMVAALSAAADFDEWYCGTPYPRHWPHRRGDLFDEVSDPITALVVDGARQLVEAGGSEALQKTLGQALAEIGPARD
jgi:hypothetical protein